jgi:hypothetical protein
MKTDRFLNRCMPGFIVLTLLLTGVSAVVAPSTQGASIVIDGVKEAAWGAPLASDPIGDMSEPNLDMHGLYVTEDTANYYIGFDATASDWGMTYGIYIDTNQVDGSGATSDPWGRAINAVSTHLPEHTIYVFHEDWDTLQDVQLNHWDGSVWSYDSLTSQGGEQGYGPANDWIEYRVPKAALGNPTRISLEVFTTGGSGHAQDTVPSDPNVAYSVPDWGGDVTTLSAFALFPPPEWYVRGDFNGWGTADPMYDDGTNGDATAGDGIYTALVSIAIAGSHEFKVASEDWSDSYPGSGNSWLDTTTADEAATITFDINTYSDGWLPETNIIGVSTEPGAWTAVGDWQGWNNDDVTTAMILLSGGIYEFTTPIASPGSHQYKAVKTATWDAIGADGRSVNANTAAFETIEAGQNVTFRVDALVGRVSVEVEPVLPISNPNGPYFGAAGSPIDFDGTGSSDPNNDPLTYNWDCGDSDTETGATPSHTYSEAGIYNVCLTVTNDGGLSDIACTYAVVYDPSAGFITGGGWIDSLEGAYVPDPALTGRANFGFISKYNKGAEVPTGQTEFMLYTADLNFYSDSYDWLVVTGANYAMFKGKGTINGEGDYKFMLWAGDGEPDTFRIRIWEEDEFGNETDIYDNGFDQVIGGGAIVIHTKKK